MKTVPPSPSVVCARISSPDGNGPSSSKSTNSSRTRPSSSHGSSMHKAHSHSPVRSTSPKVHEDNDFFAVSSSGPVVVRNMTVQSFSFLSPRTPTPTRKRATSLVEEKERGAHSLAGSCNTGNNSKPGNKEDFRIKNLFSISSTSSTTPPATSEQQQHQQQTPQSQQQHSIKKKHSVSTSGSIPFSPSSPSTATTWSSQEGSSPMPTASTTARGISEGGGSDHNLNTSAVSGSSSSLSGKRVMALHQQLLRSTTSLPFTDVSCAPASESSAFGLSGNTTMPNNNSGNNTATITSQWKSASRRYEIALNSSNTQQSLVENQISNGSGPLVPLTTLHFHHYHHHPQQKQSGSASVRLQSSAGATTADLQPTTTMLPSGSGPDSDSDLSSEQSQDAHSGVIMALPGPGLNASMGSLAAGTGSGGAGARVSSPMNGRSSNRGGQESAMLGWNRFNNSMSTLVSQSLVSRLSTHRPQFSSIGSSNWSVVRVMNTCHLLYLVPVTTITVGRLLTTETICDEQLFSWLTVQAFLFMSQIICACYILQRQTMSTRVTILDQRARVLLLVFMIWTVIGVGFLGADGRSGSNSNNNSNNQGPSCSPAEDPIYSLSFKIIVFHISLIGFYFLPCSSFLLSRVLPSSIASGLTRTATKPMIDKLGSMPMTDGLFGADPEEAQCAICLGEYSVDETIRFLPCQHHFHQECVDQWLLTDKSCPLCKHDIDKPLEAERAALVNSRIFHYHQQQQQQQQQNQQSQVAAGSNSGRNDPEALTMYPNGFQIIVI